MIHFYKRFQIKLALTGPIVGLIKLVQRIPSRLPVTAEDRRLSPWAPQPNSIGWLLAVLQGFWQASPGGQGLSFILERRDRGAIL